METPNVIVEGLDMEVNTSVKLPEKKLGELLLGGGGGDGLLLSEVFQLVRKMPLGLSLVTAPTNSKPAFEPEICANNIAPVMQV